MKIITGEQRADLEELVKQLREHGPGGGSAALSRAYAKFGAITTHGLSCTLANMLLSLELRTEGGGGCGGAGAGGVPDGGGGGGGE